MDELSAPTALTELLAMCRARGVRLSLAGSPTYKAPTGAMSPGLLARLKENMPALLTALQAEDLREHFEARAGILEHDGVYLDPILSSKPPG